MLMKGTWIVELEMDVMLRTKKPASKASLRCAMMSTCLNANDPIKLARRTILVGTINPEGDGSYLRDQTGATRVLPVRWARLPWRTLPPAGINFFAEALCWFQDHPADWWTMPEAATEELTLIRETRRKEGAYEGPRLQEWLARVKAWWHRHHRPVSYGRRLAFLLQHPAGTLDGGDERSGG